MNKFYFQTHKYTWFYGLFCKFIYHPGSNIFVMFIKISQLFKETNKAFQYLSKHDQIFHISKLTFLRSKIPCCHSTRKWSLWKILQKGFIQAQHSCVIQMYIHTKTAFDPSKRLLNISRESMHVPTPMSKLFGQASAVYTYVQQKKNSFPDHLYIS